MTRITSKSISLSLLAASLALLMTACDDSSTGPDPGNGNESQLAIYTINDIPADTARAGIITYYSLRDSSIVGASDSASTDWDIAFSGLTIYVNSGTSGPGEGGVVILDQSFDATVMAPSEGYHVDTDTLLAIPGGTDNGWYHYTNEQEPAHAVLPLENKTMVIKTADGSHFAKLNILSYYKGNPDTSTEEFAKNPRQRPTSPMYTFTYAIQMNGTTELN